MKLLVFVFKKMQGNAKFGWDAFTDQVYFDKSTYIEM